MTVEMCLSEIKNCQDSAGINFVLLSTQKCGYQPIPRRIDAAVLSEIMEIADSSEASCLNMYYCLDFNSLEPKYILQAGNLSQSEWSKRESELRGILQSCAKRAWPTLDIRDPTCNHPAKDFFISVTEMEICNGILGQGGRDDKCCVFILTITDLEDAVNAALLSNVAEEKKLVSNYIDMLQDRVDSEAQEKLMWGKTIMIPSVYKLDILNTSVMRSHHLTYVHAICLSSHFSQSSHCSFSVIFASNYIDV